MIHENRTIVKPTHSNGFMLSDHRFQFQKVELSSSEEFNMINITGGPADLEMSGVKLKTVKARWCNKDKVKIAYL